MTDTKLGKNFRLVQKVVFFFKFKKIMKRQNLRKPNAFWSDGFKSAAEIEKTGTNSNFLNDTSNFRTSDLDRLSKSGLRSVKNSIPETFYC